MPRDNDAPGVHASDALDVLIVGAGIIGCAIAHELARRGAAVRVIDDRAPGMGATQASAGMLAPYLEARDPGPLLQLGARSLGLYDPFVDAAVATSGIPVRYQRTGTLDVALHPEGVDQLEASAKSLRILGIDARMLNGGEARAAEPHLSVEVRAGLMISEQGYVAAHSLTAALASAAQKRGARFLPPARVTAIAQGTDISVETTAGKERARHVVLAAGSWSGDIPIEGVSPLPVKPVRGQLVQLAWDGPPLARVVWGERCYLVPWDDGTLLVGATSEDAGFDERTTVAGVHDLMEAAAELVPHAWAAALSGARAGLRPGSPDELPMIGPSAVIPNLMYACGHFRNGVLLAPLTADLVAGLLLDGRVDPMLELTKPQRFGVC